MKPHGSGKQAPASRGRTICNFFCLLSPSSVIISLARSLWPPKPLEPEQLSQSWARAASPEHCCSRSNWAGVAERPGTPGGEASRRRRSPRWGRAPWLRAWGNRLGSAGPIPRSGTPRYFCVSTRPARPQDRDGQEASDRGGAGSPHGRPSPCRPEPALGPSRCCEEQQEGGKALPLQPILGSHLSAPDQSHAKTCSWPIRCFPERRWRSEGSWGGAPCWEAPVGTACHGCLFPPCVSQRGRGLNGVCLCS